MDKKNKEEQMVMFGLKETLDRMAKANGVRWYGRVIRTDDDNILKKAMMLEVIMGSSVPSKLCACARAHGFQRLRTRVNLLRTDI